MDSPFQHPSFGGTHHASSTEGERVAFLRKVYLLMTSAVAVSGVTAALASTVGEPVMLRGGMAIPPVVAWFAMHPFIGFLLMLGSVMGAGAVSRRPGLNVAALYGVAAIVGLVIAPAIFVAQLKASMGASLSSAPVLHAFGLATAGFTGLSAYALTTKRDFSALRGFLGMGLFVVIGASVLNLFLGASVLSLAIASVTILLFGGFVLYDTQRMLREDDLEPVPAALNLYLNFLNLFLALLRILSGGRRD
jgi:modulator of FtsH protease